MENVIVTKSKDFAVRIIRAYKYLTSENILCQSSF